MKALQWADRKFGPLAVALFGGSRVPLRPLSPGVQAPSKILMIRPGGMGDAVLTLPLVAALARRLPEASIDVLAEARNFEVYAIGDTGVAEVVRYDISPLATFAKLRARRYDVVIDTEQFHVLSTIYASRLRAGRLAGFDTFGRRAMLTDTAPYSEDDYEVHSFLRLFSVLTGEEARFDPDTPFLTPHQNHFEWADGALASASGQPIASVMCAAGAPRRLWPVERLTLVCAHLRRRGFRVALIGGGDGRARAAEIRKALGEGCEDFTGSTSLARTAALLARSAVCVTPDTGILHLAYAVGTPTLSLFGSGVRAKWAPPGTDHVWVSANLDCSPCTSWGRTPECGRDNACMTALPVETVTRALDGLIDQIGRKSSG